MTMYGAAVMHVGIDGPDHIGVVEEPDDLHLAEEPGDRRACSMHASGTTTLSATTRSIRRCRALKTRPRAPLADVVEQDIAAEGQALLPPQEPTGLELRQRPPP